MSKRVTKVKKTLRQGALEVAYLDENMATKYATVNVPVFTQNRDSLRRMASTALGRDGIKLLAITETLYTYEMDLEAFKKAATFTGGVEGATITLDN